MKAYSISRRRPDSNRHLFSFAEKRLTIHTTSPCHTVLTDLRTQVQLVKDLDAQQLSQRTVCYFQIVVQNYSNMLSTKNQQLVSFTKIASQL